MHFYRNVGGYWKAMESLETVLEHRFKHVIFVQNEEERDFLEGLELVSGVQLCPILREDWTVERLPIAFLSTYYFDTEDLTY